MIVRVEGNARNIEPRVDQQNGDRNDHHADFSEFFAMKIEDAREFERAQCEQGDDSPNQFAGLPIEDREQKRYAEPQRQADGALAVRSCRAQDGEQREGDSQRFIREEDEEDSRGGCNRWSNPTAEIGRDGGQCGAQSIGCKEEECAAEDQNSHNSCEECAYLVIGN